MEPSTFQRGGGRLTPAPSSILVKFELQTDSYRRSELMSVQNFSGVYCLCCSIFTQIIPDVNILDSHGRYGNNSLSSSFFCLVIDHFINFLLTMFVNINNVCCTKILKTVLHRTWTSIAGSPWYCLQKSHFCSLSGFD